MGDIPGEGMRFSPRISKDKSFCVVYGCSSNSSRDPTVRFHTFPTRGQTFVKITNKRGISEKIDKFKAWEQAIKIGKPITPTMRICSLHFKKEDYFLPDVQSKRKNLKISAVPSYNLPKRSTDKVTETAENKNRTKRILEREQKRQLIAKETVKKVETPAGEDSPMEVDANEKCVETQSLLDIPPLSSTAEIGIQVQSGDLVPTLRSLIKSDRQLSTLTGIENFTILERIVDIVHIMNPNIADSKSTVQEQILMTYIKLKQNASYALLAIFSRMYSAQSCKRIFLRMLDVLSRVLRVAIPFPSKTEISRNIPTCFEGFEDVRVVLDCTEIFLQKPKNLCCQILTYSFYKGTYTVKFMTGVTPAGMISFISKPYGGRSSDKAIFVESNLLEKLQANDAVMVDKGFLIDDICKKNDLKLIRPPFLKKQKQFSSVDACLTAKIAKARVHIERANQRLKTFKILGDKLPSKLASKIEQIFTIICGTVNIGSPILKNNKFPSL
ncbi:uncharacterized protein LOC124405587 [Diprion similis]|uniref:uncharacterized protein LOC124405587 n=1 Tax=Diprion similis TaxID=362088 RepID=UPI001EF92D5F|nr:uncharacterized protein LOC124405587 [Diprion similis]